VGQGRLGHDAHGDAGGGDPHLAGREVDLQVVGHLPGPAESRLVELGLGVLAHPGQRELDGNEESVGCDEEDTGDEPPANLAVVTEVVGADRYLFSPGDYADAILEYAAEVDADRIVLDPEYRPAGAAPMLRPLEIELARGDTDIEEAPVERPTERTVLARAASLPKYLAVFGASYLFYMLLSAWKPLDFFTGFLTATLVAVLLAPVAFSRQPAFGRVGKQLLRMLVYAPYLLKEIAVANLQIAYVVLHPSLPIDPKLVELEAAVWGDTAVTTLANSITLTPGTLTVTVTDRSFTIHSLTAGAREDLFDGGLERAVRFVFYGREAAAIATPRERGDDGGHEDG
jgi:multicomponent Na+:H+ antiporter subunit E